MLYSTESAAWMRFISLEKIEEVLLVRLAEQCGEAGAYRRMYRVADVSGMSGWVLKPKLRIETTMCGVCCMEFCEFCPGCARAPASLPCRCAPTMCRGCLLKWVNETRTWCCDDPDCANVYFSCSTCRAEVGAKFPVGISCDY